MIGEPTPEESRAVATLHRLAKRWPDTLMIASMAGTLYVLHVAEDGGSPMTPGGGIDPDYIVDSIGGIPNTGGDW